MYIKRERDMAAVQGYVDADEFNTMPKTQTQVTEETTQQVVADNYTKRIATRDRPHSINVNWIISLTQCNRCQ